MSVKEITFLDCLDEEIEKAPNEFQKGLKEIFGYITIRAGLTNSYSVSDFITAFWDLANRLEMDIYHKAVVVLSKARRQLTGVKI